MDIDEVGKWPEVAAEAEKSLRFYQKNFFLSMNMHFFIIYIRYIFFEHAIHVFQFAPKCKSGWLREHVKEFWMQFSCAHPQDKQRNSHTQ